jgi:hypothetical protein
MNLLLSIFPIGAFSLLILFGVCFLLIHIVKLIKIGWLAQKKNSSEQKEEEKTPAPSSAQEPVYYIVERKRRTKSSYGEPKRIRFK